MASFSLSVASEKHRFFAFMTSLSSGRLSECGILERNDEKWWGGVRSTIHIRIISCSIIKCTVVHLSCGP